MAQFRVLYRSLVNGRIAEPGAIVSLDPLAMVASANLQALDDDAQAMRDDHDERIAESAPPGSATANEIRRMMLAGRTLNDAEVQAMHTYPRRST